MYYEEETRFTVVLGLQLIFCVT